MNEPRLNRKFSKFNKYVRRRTKKVKHEQFKLFHWKVMISQYKTRKSKHKFLNSAKTRFASKLPKSRSNYCRSMEAPVPGTHPWLLNIQLSRPKGDSNGANFEFAYRKLQLTRHYRLVRAYFLFLCKKVFFVFWIVGSLILYIFHFKKHQIYEFLILVENFGFYYGELVTIR